MFHSPLPIPDSRLMSDHHARFLQLALHAQALRFGQFTLKSGRQSPYFFNAGRFDSGTLLAGLAACYALGVISHFFPPLMMWVLTFAAILAILAILPVTFLLCLFVCVYSANRKSFDAN